MYSEKEEAKEEVIPALESTKMAIAASVVLYEPPAEEPLARWVEKEVVGVGLKDDISMVQSAVMSSSATSTAAEVAMGEVQKIAAKLACQQTSDGSCDGTATKLSPQASTESPGILCLVIAIFWDGQSEQSKTALGQLKQLTEQKVLMSVSSGTSPQSIEIVVQALNAKKGDAALLDNKAALVSSLRKRVQSSVMATKGLLKSRQPSSGGNPCHVDPSVYSASNTSSIGTGATPQTATAAPAGFSAAASSIGEKDLSTAALSRAVEGGQGECFFLLSSDSSEGLSAQVATLKANCATADIGCSAVAAEPRVIQLPASHTGTGGVSSGGGATAVAQEFLLRRICPPFAHLELRLAMCGNVDSGKSTLTSVLTRGCRDDGRGLARAFVFNHKHEAMTGRTSSVSENHLGFSATGEVVNYALLLPNRKERDAVSVAPAVPVGEHGSGPGATRMYTPQELALKSSKVITLYDLAGHERYLKTTVLGMTRNMPDYACIVISANNGIQRMTKEHLALCLALKLPFFIVVTRIDATPSNVHEETISNIHKLLKIPTVRKLPYPVRRYDEVVLAAKNLRHDRIAPIFEVSNVSGDGIADVLQFLNLLPIRKDWKQARLCPKEMIIDSTFFVTGVGTVVGGIITQGVFRVNDTVLLGPDGFGHYRPVAIKSIHIKGVDSPAVEAGNDAALCLKKEKRSAIRKGNILADPAAPPKSYWQFEAEVTILYHSTTITTNYEPVIHSSTVRQSARITYVAQEVLRTGDRSIARFHFLYRPEYMKEGQRLIFREGRTKGIGVVTKMLVDADPSVLKKNRQGRRDDRVRK